MRCFVSIEKENEAHFDSPKIIIFSLNINIFFIAFFSDPFITRQNITHGDKKKNTHYTNKSSR